MVTLANRGIQLLRARPTDAELLPDFFARLSEESLYRRFSSPVRELSGPMIDQMVRLDRSHGVSLLAVQRRPLGRKRLIGVAQIFGPVGAPRAEGGLLVADDHQGLGLGSALIEALVRICQERGIGAIWGLVQPDNGAMLALARNRGYPVSHSDLGLEVHVPAWPKNGDVVN